MITYSHLHLPIGASARSVIRAARRLALSSHRRSLHERKGRREFYLRMLASHFAAQDRAASYRWAA
jgi:hypothetical protein